MTFTSGEPLLFMETHREHRVQFQQLMAYLNSNGAENQHVCALYGLRRTGKTTLIIQAVKALIHQGISPESIGYITGKKSDDFNDIYLELQDNRHKLKYIFIDEIGFFANFLQDGNFLYDTLVRVYNCKVVIAGTNLLALYVAMKRTLYDRCKIINVPYLSFAEHCKFVLNKSTPSKLDLVEYMKFGGLFDVPGDTAEYVQTSITDSVVELFDTQPESEVFVWLKPEAENVNWKGYINTILFLSSNYISNRRLQEHVSLVKDFEALDIPVQKQVVREFKQYFSLSKQDREYRMKRTETVALLDFLVQCGIIAVLPNMYSDVEPYKCYVRTPFLRYHFTEKLRDLSGAETVNEQTTLFGDLLEATVVCEYLEAYPGNDICFARTHVSPDEVAEIDLVDRTQNKAYEVKLGDGKGYSGYYKLNGRPELDGIEFTMLNEDSYTGFIYGLGVQNF